MAANKIILNKKFLIILFVLAFFPYVFHNSLVERRLFVNEIFSLTGLLFFITLKRSKWNLIVNKNIIEVLVIFFLLNCIIYLFLSIPFATNIYYYLRNSVIFYSVFSFFLGYYIFDGFVEIHKYFRRVIKYSVFSFIFFEIHRLLGYFGGSIALAFSFKKITLLSGALLILFNIIYTRNFEQSTALAIGFFLFYALIFRSFRFFKFLVISGIVILLSLILYLSPALKQYKYPPYRLYGNTTAVIQAEPLFLIDPNSAFRFILYYRLLIEDFPGNIIGKGFGTPLFKYEPGMNTADSRGDDEHDAHVTGAHSTFITIFSRLGIMSLIIFILLYYNFFKEYFKYFKYYNNKGYLLFFIAFISISIIGIFNLVLETPIFASMYWLILGFVSKSIDERKKEN